MMLRKLLENKKIVILVFVVLLALIIGIFALVTPRSKETGDKKSDTKIEQSDKEDNNEGDDSGLEVLDPNEVVPGDSSDASGSWGNSSSSNVQDGKTNTTDLPEEQNQNKVSTESEEQEDSEIPEQNEEILEDDISWGNIY